MDAQLKAVGVSVAVYGAPMGIGMQVDGSLDDHGDIDYQLREAWLAIGEAVSEKAVGWVTVMVFV